jgi:hypothetical protein
VNGGDERKLFVVLMYFVSANEHAAVIYFRESDMQVRKGEIRTQISTVKGGRLPQLLSLRANALLDFRLKRDRSTFSFRPPYRPDILLPNEGLCSLPLLGNIKGRMPPYPHSM